MMNKEEKIKIAKKINLINLVYGKRSNDEAALYQAELLSDLPYLLVNATYDELVKTNTSNNPPNVGQVREMIQPQTDDRSIAIELTRKLFLAATRHGFFWEYGFWENENRYFEGFRGLRFETFKAAFLSELGELGWEIVQNRGGWQNLISNMDEESLQNEIEVFLKNKKAGIDVSKIPLPHPFQDVIKTLVKTFEL